jgi:hypothetical protein
MLARLGVIFTHLKFLGHGARVLLRHIEVPRSCRALQLDLDRRRFGHFGSRLGWNGLERGNILCRVGVSSLVSRPERCKWRLLLLLSGCRRCEANRLGVVFLIRYQ